MNVDVLGILDDGSPRAPGVPTSTRKTLQVAAGQDLTVRLSLVFPTGQLVALEGASATLRIEQYLSGLDPLVSVDGALVASAGPGRADFAIPGSATLGLPPGRYLWEIWLVTVGGKRERVVDLSAFVVTPGAPPASGVPMI